MAASPTETVIRILREMEKECSRGRILEYMKEYADGKESQDAFASVFQQAHEAMEILRLLGDYVALHSV